MNERVYEATESFERDVVEAFSDCYGISGTEKLLVRNAIQTVSDRIRAQEGRNLDLNDVFDIGLELEKFGFDNLLKDNLETLYKYGDQLIWEGDEFGKPDKKKAGQAIIRRLLLGKGDQE